MTAQETEAKARAKAKAKDSAMPWPEAAVAGTRRRRNGGTARTGGTSEAAPMTSGSGDD